MAQLIIENPEMYETVEVSDAGRVYIGKDWAGKDIKIAVERVDESCSE
jgi:hypothetical protein